MAARKRIGRRKALKVDASSDVAAPAPKTVEVFVPSRAIDGAEMVARLREQARVASLRSSIAKQMAAATRACATQVPGFVEGRFVEVNAEELPTVADACQRFGRAIVQDIVAALNEMAAMYESSAANALGRAEMAAATAEELSTQRGPEAGTSGTIPAHPDGHQPH